MTIEKLAIWIAINKINPELCCQFIAHKKEEAIMMAEVILKVEKENIALHFLDMIPFWSMTNE